MERADYVSLFSVPEFYRPPDDIDLFKDTKYPNSNSRDYRKFNDRTINRNEFFECLAVNEDNLAVIATNEITGRKWNGIVWGYEGIPDIGDSISCFKVHCDSPVTKLQFLQSKIVILLTQMNGTVSLWSTQSEARDANGYCLFMIASKTEHLGIICGLDILLPERTKIVTGSNDCSLKIWDSGAADLTSILTMRNAHSDDITSVSSYSSLSETFFSCSRDKSALLWDYRIPRPANALYENHSVAFTTIASYDANQKQGGVLLGDESGYVCHVDVKMPQKFVSRTKIFDRPVRKVSYNGQKIAVIGNTNSVHVYNCENALLYENQEAKNFIRDTHWIDDNLLCTISWDGQLLKHLIVPQKMLPFECQ